MTDLVFYLFVFFVVGVFFLFIHLLIGKLIRPYRPDAEKMTIYECGEPTVGSAWIQFDLRYYVVALLFVVFDVEVAFFFPWAVVFGKANEVARLPGSAQELNRTLRRLDSVERELQSVSLSDEEKKKLTDEESKKLTADKERLTAEKERLTADTKRLREENQAALESSREQRAKITNELTPANLNLVYFETVPAPKPKPKGTGGPGKKGGAPKKEGKGGPALEGGEKKVSPAIVQPVDPDVMRTSPPPVPVKTPIKSVTPIDPDTAQTWAWIAFGDILVFFGVLMVGFAYLWKRGDIDWVRSTAAEDSP